MTVLNFGLIDIDWGQQPAQITLKIVGQGGNTLAEEKVEL